MKLGSGNMYNENCTDDTLGVICQFDCDEGNRTRAADMYKFCVT